MEPAPTIARTTRDQILDASYALFMERGYDLTSIQMIIDAVGIAKGTFYHHFRSKDDLLDDLVERLMATTVAIMEPVVGDPELRAIEKFVAMFSSVGQWKLEHRALMVDLTRALHAEANASLRERIFAASMSLMEPRLVKIVEQGVAEGVFHTRYPQAASRILVRILYSLSLGMQEQLLCGDTGPHVLAGVRVDVAAHQEAAERVLAAPAGSLQWIADDVLPHWFDPEEAP